MFAARCSDSEANRTQPRRAGPDPGVLVGDHVTMNLNLKPLILFHDSDCHRDEYARLRLSAVGRCRPDPGFPQPGLDSECNVTRLTRIALEEPPDA